MHGGDILRSSIPSHLRPTMWQCRERRKAILCRAQALLVVALACQVTQPIKFAVTFWSTEAVQGGLSKYDYLATSVFHDLQE